MRNKNQVGIKIIGISFMLLFSMFGFAQQKNGYAVVTGGITNLRSFSSSLYDAAGYSINDQNGNQIDYKLRSEKIPLYGVGLGFNSQIGHNGRFSWDVQANIRSAGYQIQVVPLLEQHLDFISDGYLPQFGSKSTYRYWAVHVPISIDYQPFDWVGFKVGVDVHYQLSENPASNNHGSLRQQLGTAHELSYQYPVNFGTHVGIFIPAGDQLRFDVQAFSDLSSRLSLLRSPTNQFREMGVSVSLRYSLF